MEFKLKESILPQKSSYSIIEKIFAARGIPPDEIFHYLNPTDDDLYSPHMIDRIDDGVKMLARHIAAADNVLMIVDCDVDGYTSSALLLNYLYRNFPAFVLNHITYCIHDGKQHGIEDKFVDKAVSENYKLVICADSSSNDYGEHKALKDNGIDVLVIDHHEADKLSDDACVINNQLCGYPNKYLSGVGMVYKVCQYFDEQMKWGNLADDFLDLVAIGLVSDMMSIKELETKRLIEKGINNLVNPFVKEIVKVQDYSISRAGGLNPFSISFYIAPLVNATIRVGTQDEKVLLFKSMLEFEAYKEIASTKRGCSNQTETIIEQAGRNCNNIKTRQGKIKDSDLEIIDNLIKENHLDKNKIIAVKIPKVLKINKNITGLIANNLMATYQHPILLLNEIEINGEKAWEGSGRGYTTSNFSNFKDFLKLSGYVYLAEGHQSALGVGILDKDFDSFIQYSNEKLKDCNFTPCYQVDMVESMNQMRPDDILEIAKYNSIWGQDMDQPLFAFENVGITRDNLTLLSPDKSPTLKIVLTNGTSLIKFKASQEEYENLLPTSPSGRTEITVVGACNINEWNGRITPQIEVKDYEITNRKKFSF